MLLRCSSASLCAILFRRAYEQLLPYFEDMLESQGWLDTQEKSDKILEYIDTSTEHSGEQRRSEEARNVVCRCWHGSAGQMLMRLRPALSVCAHGSA